MRTAATATAFLGALSFTHAIDLDLNSKQSILAAASTIKDDIIRIYNNNSTGPEIPGLFPSTYYWWEAGLAFGSLINYVTLSGDTSLVSTIQDALLWQIGPDNNFMPPNQTKDEGNDDQSPWALAAMTAAEQGFPQKSGQQVSWLQLAENVFNSQVLRWDTSTCNGGLRWQIFSFNAGYDYKNSASQGGLALLAARLAKFTGNTTYSDWAKKTTQWCQDIGLITAGGAVYDGTSTTSNCTSLNHIRWSYEAGYFIGSSAYLSNSTNTSQPLLDPLLNTSLSTFTKNNIIYESACQPKNNCDTDELAFRASFVRNLAAARDLTNTSAPISSVLSASAKGAAAQCSGGASGTTCGSDWSSATWDGTSGLGQDLSAMNVILANLPSAKIVVGAGGNGTATTGSVNGTRTGIASGTAVTSAVPTSGASEMRMRVSMSWVGLGVLMWGLFV